MNQKNLVSIIVFDIIVMLLAIGLIVFRYSSLSELSSLPSMRTAPAAHDNAPQPAQAPEPPAAQPADTALPAPAISQDTASQEKPRNIAFTFRHSRAKKVDIIGDFNGWAPKPLTKGKDYRWSITLALEPGEYAYNFVVDGKPIRDPNNPKTCDIGRGFPNSLLKVRPRAKENN